jgi:hypothetical protein
MRHYFKLFILFFLFSSYGLMAQNFPTPLQSAELASDFLKDAGIDNRVTEDEDENIGCEFNISGTSWFYVQAGTYSWTGGNNYPTVQRVPLNNISHVLIQGCLVYASCSFKDVISNPDVSWAKIISAVVNFNGDGNYEGHAVLIFKRRNTIYMQENGGWRVPLYTISNLYNSGHTISVLQYFDTWYPKSYDGQVLVSYIKQ